MTIPHLNDEIVDQVSIDWDNQPGRFLTQVQANLPDPKLQRIVRSFLLIGTWDDALFMAEGVHARESRSMDMRAFAYPLPDVKPTDPDYEELVFDGVNICDGAFEYVNLSERAFTQLMAVLFDVLISGATQNQLPVTREDWWSSFVKLAADIRERAKAL